MVVDSVTSSVIKQTHVKVSHGNRAHVVKFKLVPRSWWLGLICGLYGYLYR